MKQSIAIIAILVLVTVIIIPFLVVKGLDGTSFSDLREIKMVKTEDITIRVYLHETGKTVEMSLEEYIKGVVAAEMPVEFEQEALKAQAVAARTYAVKHMTVFGGQGYGKFGADVSSDSRDSQAWVSERELKLRWGAQKYSLYFRKISQAVEATRGMIITYNGEPVNAVFHSTSGDKTASAIEVWGVDYPYLQSVASTWDKQSPRYSDTKELLYSDLEAKLGWDAGVMTAVQSGNSDVVQIIERTPSGRVAKARIGSKTLSGQEIREQLGLRSTNFNVEQQSSKIVFKTLGYGHGVGMSQYGANGMAKEGKSYKQIITYYYQGVALSNLYGS